MPVLEVTLPNDTTVQATTEEWIAAILSVLTPEQQTKIFHVVQQKRVFVRTPGSYILHAEKGSYSFK